MEMMYKDPKLIGLALCAFGVLLLIAKLIYDIASRSAQARVELKSIESNMLMSGAYKGNSDRTLRSRLERKEENEKKGVRKGRRESYDTAGLLEKRKPTKTPIPKDLLKEYDTESLLKDDEKEYETSSLMQEQGESTPPLASAKASDFETSPLWTEGSSEKTEFETSALAGMGEYKTSPLALP